MDLLPRLERFVSHTIIVALLSLGVLITAPRAYGQATAATFDSRAANNVWIVGAIGGAQDAGITSGYGVWAAHGPLVVGVQTALADNLAGTSRRQRAVLGGVRLSMNFASLMLAAGPGTVSECLSNGEQSGTCARSSYRQAAFDFALELVFVPMLGGRLAYSGALTGDHGFKAILIGFEIGKLR